MKVSDPELILEYYKALINKDSNYIGTFYVGVKTTSIFCVPTCTAKKPKLANVEFFSSVSDSLKNGYRPCKVCRPSEKYQNTPIDIKKVFDLIHKNPKEKISDQFLRENDIDPQKVRRWFKKNYSLTFHKYQRMIRINTAFEELRNGENTTQIAYSSGYESLSGFGYTFKKIMQNPPSKSKLINRILLTRFTTPLGPMFVATTDLGLCLLEFTDRRMLENEFRDLQSRLNAQIIVGKNNITNRTILQIQQYFEGERKNFDLPLLTPGTAFQNLVWDHLKTIPYGYTSSYAEQAKKIGNLKAIRAIANANGMNRIAIVIPCHRIIGSDGKMVGYGGGVARKKWLLDFEKKTLISSK